MNFGTRAMHGNCDRLSASAAAESMTMRSLPEPQLQGSLKLEDPLLNSCLIGSPTRAHERTEDILCMNVPQQSAVVQSTECPSRIMAMLTKLKAEVKSLKANRPHEKDQHLVSKKRSPPNVVKLSNTGESKTGARDKLREIEMMLVDAEDSLQWLNERLSRVNTEQQL